MMNEAQNIDFVINDKMSANFRKEKSILVLTLERETKFHTRIEVVKLPPSLIEHHVMKWYVGVVV